MLVREENVDQINNEPAIHMENKSNEKKILIHKYKFTTGII